MKILIISDSFPFPPKNGKDLPIAKIFSKLKSKAKVDLLLLSNASQVKKENILAKKSIYIDNTYIISFIKRKRGLGKKISNSMNFDLNEVKEFSVNKAYDWIWVSPITCYSFVSFCEKYKIKFYNKVALGLNDELSYSYKNRFYKMMRQKSYNIKGLGWLLQSWYLKKEQRKVFKNIDLIHLQTDKEKTRLLKVIGESIINSEKIVVAPNGINETLLDCTYNGIVSTNILCMTQLGGGRRDECKWFFKESWPIIKKSLPNVKLLVVGSPPEKELAYLVDDQIEIMGYVDDLKEVFELVILSIVPTFHSSGLINRIQDSLVAGIPTVTTKKALDTFSFIENEKDIYATNSSKEFAHQVINLYQNKDLRKKTSIYAKKYSTNLHTWDETSNKIYKKLNSHDR